jgi:hypothetical protein
MNPTTDKSSTSTHRLPQAISEALASFEHLVVDDRLALLWAMHQSVGCSLTACAPGAARLFLTQGLLNRVKQMSPAEQLSVIRDLLTRTDTPITRQYGMFVPKTKLAFWSQLFEWMYKGEVAPVSTSYELSPTGVQLFKQIMSLDYNEQIELVRQALIDTGIDPEAV